MAVLSNLVRERAVKTTEDLAIEVFEAREALNCHAQRNVFGMNYEDRKASAVQFALAQERAFKARAALDAHISSPGNKQEN